MAWGSLFHLSLLHFCIDFVSRKRNCSQFCVFEAYEMPARLAQLGERRSAEREVVNPGRTNTQGLKITEEKVLSL